MGLASKRSGLAAAALVILTGCTSPAGTQVTQQQINDALKRASHGQVEFALSYCDADPQAPKRIQVVDLMRQAVFASTPLTPYEVAVTPFQTPTGDLVVSLRSKWIEHKNTPSGPSEVYVLNDKTAVIKNDGTGEPLTFTVGEWSTCVTLSAKTLPAVSTASADSLP